MIGALRMLALVALLTVTGCGSSTFTMTGSITLADGGYGTSWCTGTGGYADIREGATVTVYDAAGTTVAVGGLDPGQRVSGTCLFPFTVHDVPGRLKFYAVEVSHRGRVTVPGTQARERGVSMTLG